MDNSKQNTEREISIVKEVELIVTNRKIKIIGIAIIIGLIIVYGRKKFVPYRLVLLLAGGHGSPSIWK